MEHEKEAVMIYVVYEGHEGGWRHDVYKMSKVSGAIFDDGKVMVGKSGRCWMTFVWLMREVLKGKRTKRNEFSVV